MSPQLTVAALGLALTGLVLGCSPKSDDPDFNRSKPRPTTSLLSPTTPGPTAPGTNSSAVAKPRITLTPPAPASTPLTPAEAQRNADRGVPAGAPVFGEGLVTRIVDGDTVTVRLTTLANGSASTTGPVETVRLLGVDTPETKKPGVAVQCWGPEATNLASSVLLGRPVIVVLDPTQAVRDRYGRLLAYLITTTGVNYSVYAAEQGAARVYVYGKKPVLVSGQIAAAEAVARDLGRGLWGKCVS